MEAAEGIVVVVILARAASIIGLMLSISAAVLALLAGLEERIEATIALFDTFMLRIYF